MKTRTQQLIELLDTTPEVLENFSGIETGIIESAIKAGEDLNPVQKLKIIQEMDFLSADWYLKGNGEPFTKSIPKDFLKESTTSRSKTQKLKKGRHVEACQRFKEFRVAEGYSQPEFALSLGTEKHQVNQVEYLRYNPSLFLLEEMYKKHRLNINWLITGEGSMKRSVLNEGKEISELKEEIERLTKQNEKLKRALIEE